jgi:hypothetical protein
MANQHAVSVTGVSIPSTAEVVIATMTPFNENQPGAGGQAFQGGFANIGSQGVVLSADLNITPSAGATLTLRFRYASLTGSVVTGSPAGGTVNTMITTVANNYTAYVLDPTLVQQGVVYVLTAQIGSGTATVNYGVVTALDATSIE